MDAVETMAAKVKAIEVMNVPLGTSALLLVGLGLNDIAIPAIGALTKLPPIAVGPAIAIVSQLPAVKKILGSTMAGVISATAVAMAIDQQLNIRGKTATLVSRLVGKILPPTETAGLAGASAPATVGQIAPEEFMSEQERRVLATLRVK